MRVVFLFCCLLLSNCFFGQWFDRLSTFTTQDGLSNNTVTCLQKDSTGFLWIGTHEGLNRYDGTSFLNVLRNGRNNLPSNNITQLCFINKNLLAVGTSAGLCFLNTSTITGRQIELPSLQKSPVSEPFIEDVAWNKTTNELWVATGHGLFVLTKEGVVRKKLMASPSETTKGLFARHILFDGAGQFYLYSQQKSGFYYPDFAGNSLVPVEQKKSGLSFNDLLKKGFVLRSAQRFSDEVVCTFSKTSATGNEEYIAYDNTTTGRRFIQKLLVNLDYEKRISNAFPLNDTLFEVNSFFGEPLLYNSSNGSVKRAADHPLWFTSWPDGLGAFLVKDHDNIWIGTSKGLLQSSLKGGYLKTSAALGNVVQSHQSLVSYNYGLYEGNKFWTACIGPGLFSLDSTTSKIETIFSKKTPPAFVKKTISTAIVDAGKSLWLFSVYGPAQVDKKSGKLSAVQGINKDSAFDDLGRLPLKDRAGNIWTSLPNGLAKYNIASNTFVNYKSKYYGGLFPLLRPGPKTEDGHGNIWMARQDTLVKFDPVKETFTIAFVNKGGKRLRPVTAMASDGGDLLYLSVNNDFGIYHISTGAVDLYSKQTGIVSTAINDVVSDNSGNAWMATEGGLVFYNRAKASFSSFTTADGLPDDNVTGANFADEGKTTLFLGFTKSYCLLQPQAFLAEKSLPQNVITRIDVDDQSLAPDGYADLSYGRNSLSFSYTGINYNQGRQNNYACMLEGFDKEWKYTGTEQKINYVNLPPGRYTFKVKAANHQGEWNDEAATFSFRIEPPFWQRWWFIALMIAGVFFGIYYFIKRREVAIQKETNHKLQMSELRMQALRAQMNPHFIFNSLNSIQNYILSNNTMDAAGYLSKFAKLMRRILDQSKHNFLPLGDVMETLKMYVEIEAFRFNNEFSYSFFVEEDDDLLDAPVPPMLLQPFVENAILHGLMPKVGEKGLSISCKVNDGAAVILIDDNGIGRTRAEAKAGHESQGEKLTAGMLESLQELQNSKATLQIIDKIENDTPTGTTVIFIIPLKSTSHDAT